MAVHYKSTITVNKSNSLHLRSKNKEAKKNKGTMVEISILLSKMAALKGKLSFLLKKEKKTSYTLF